MSHLLNLWRLPLPVSLAHAESLLPQLRRELTFEPDPRARALVEALAERLPAGRDPAACWTERPDPEPSSPLLTLSPRAEALDAMLPLVLAVARDQGWVVHDGQAGEVWLPDGRVLRRARAFDAPTIAPPDAAAADSPGARGAWLRARLAPVFAHHGYAARRSGQIWFDKTLPVGVARFFGDAVRLRLDHGFWLGVRYPAALGAALDSEGEPGFRVSLHRLAQANALAFTCDEPPPLLGAEPGAVVYELPCADASALARRGDELERLYGDVVLPWVDSLQTLQDLDRWANRVSDEDCPFNGLRRRAGRRLLNYHPDLLIARAVDAADFEQMARQRLALYEADAFGRGLLPQLRALLEVCGLVV